MSEHAVPSSPGTTNVPATSGASRPTGGRAPDRAGPATRASDADRDKVIDILRDQYTEGRLTLAEFTSRVAAASSARTWGELRDQLSDLPVRPPFGDSPTGAIGVAGPSAPERPPFGDSPARAIAVAGPSAPDVHLILLIVLLVVCPPAGLVYWLVCYRQTRSVTEGAGPGERP